MSDYMFMLENHLSAEQNRALAAVMKACADRGVSLFLTGAPIRDMIAGFPIKTLNFRIEGQDLKFIRALAKSLHAEILETDTLRHSATVLFPGKVIGEIGMTHQESFTKLGARPQVTPGDIYADLRSRDFTINALALSLNRASRGLLIDPTNGLGDLERRELRTISNYVFLIEPVRLFTLYRLKVQLNLTIPERTQQQVQNAREVGVEKYISPRALLRELLAIAETNNPGEILQLLDQEGLSQIILPSLTGPTLNLPSFAKLQKARQLIPFGVPFEVDYATLFFYFLTEKLSPKEKRALIDRLEMDKQMADSWLKLPARAQKLERELQSSSLKRPSLIYFTVMKYPGEVILYLLVRSSHRLVHDRIRNVLQKYMLTAAEVTETELATRGVTPDTPKFDKLYRELIAARLDARPKRVAPAPVVESSPPVVARKSP